MNNQVETAAPLWLVAAFFAALAASAGMVFWMVARRRQGLAVLRYWPRRAVPWCGWDLLLVALVYLFAANVATAAVGWMLGPKQIQPLPGEVSTEHLIAQLIEGGSIWMLLLAFLSAAVVAPVVEEFFFRALLQGWLEAAERRRRRAIPWLRRIAPRAVGPIVLTSLLFAAMHVRPEMPKHQPLYLASLIVGQAVASLVAMALGILLVRIRTGATARDLGWYAGPLLADVRLGLLAFLTMAGPIYFLYAVLATLLPKGMVPDPVPLFFFALALGALYHRTHRIVPSVVLHMALNVTSLLMAIATMGK